VWRNGVTILRAFDARPSPSPEEARGAPLDNPRRTAESLVAFLRLVRIEYCMLGAVGVLVGAYLTTGMMPDIPVMLSSAAVLFVAAGCYALDDVSDLTSDRANRRTDRPLVTGSLSVRSARITGGLSFACAALAALLAATVASLLIALGATVAVVYNRWLQGVVSLKNVLFAGAFPTPLAIGWLAGGGKPEPLFLYCVGLVFVVGLGFETMIDVADAEGDRKSGVATFATRFGTPLSSQVAATLEIAAAILVVLLFILPVDPRLQWNALFLGLASAAALCNGLIGLALAKNHATARVFKLKRMAFLTLNAGVVAIMLGLLVATV
jgi:4-hydroxybenzoate polyprenyltransferase